MDDSDAKNHLRDLRRKAAYERLAKQVESVTAANQKKPVRPTFITIRLKLFPAKLAR
jgi:hypothetical protein